MATETLRIGLEFATAGAVAAARAFQNSVAGMSREMDRFYRDASRGIDQLAVGFAKFNLAVGGVERAFQMFKSTLDLAKFSAETQQLENRFRELGGSIGSMRNATDGAVGKLDLMRFGLRAMQGDMRLTKDGMEVLLKAADTLGDKGFGDTMEIAEKFMEVLRTGRTKGLAQYGIALDETGNKQATVNALFEKFHDIASQPIEVDENLEAIERMQAATEDWLVDFKGGIGELFIEFAKFSNAVTDWLLESNHSSKRDVTQIRDAKEREAFIAANGGSVAAANRRINDTSTHAGDAYIKGANASYDQLIEMQRARMAWKPQVYTDRPVGTDAAGRMHAPGWGVLAPKLYDRKKTAGDGSEQEYSTGASTPYDMRLFTGGGERAFGSAYGVDAEGEVRFYDPNGGDLEALMNQQRTTDKFANVGKGRYYTKFGGVSEGMSLQAQSLDLESDEDRNARIADRLGIDAGFGDLLGNNIVHLEAFGDALESVGMSADSVGGAMDTMADATAAAMDAWISGEESAGKAIQRVLSMRLAAIAKENAIKSLEQFAIGTGMLFWNPAEAATHFKSGLLHAAVAAAAGYGAKQTHVPSGGGGAGGGVSRPGGGGGGGDRTEVIHVHIDGAFVGRPEELGVLLNDSIDTARKRNRVRSGHRATRIS